MKRNRILGIALMIVCVVLFFTACSNGTNEITEDIFVKMRDANDRVTLAESGEKFTYQTEFIYSDGTVITSYMKEH